MQMEVKYNPVTDGQRIKGFVTVATGDIWYYKLARNLLRSYRLFNSKYPFAIICDRENEYTTEFDDVVIIENAQKNYVDKLRALKIGPYDENFFIESDCIVYKKIEHFFELLSGSDLSAFGWNDGDLSIWFANPEKVLNKYGEKLKSIPVFCPGYFFFRKSPCSEKIFDDAMEIGNWITENKLEGGKIDLFCKGKLRDDPLLILAMKLNDCSCPAKPKVGKCIFLPRVIKILKISLLNAQLDVVQERTFTDCNILHFSTRRTKEDGLYLQQTLILDMLYKNYPKWIIRIMEKEFVRKTFHICRKVNNKILRLMKQN